MLDPQDPLATLLEAPNRRPKLLVVDDQPVNIQALYQVFAADYQVFMATSGAQALQVCRDKLPDLVLLDVVMPGIDGYEVCAQLKADGALRDIPVIFVTAHDDEAAETHGLDVGAVDFISKPINPRVVRARVKTHVTLKQQSDLMRQMVFIDGLTGVFNRRYFDERLASEWRRAARNKAPLSLIMIDVDFFKRYNDRYGHLAGDDCLRQVAGALRAQLKRPGDVVARYGGEEFACLLTETDLPGTIEVARKLEQAVRALRIAHAVSDVADVVTTSLGAAADFPGVLSDWGSLLALADEQLYAAKTGGRGRVCAMRLTR